MILPCPCEPMGRSRWVTDIHRTVCRRPAVSPVPPVRRMILTAAGQVAADTHARRFEYERLQAEQMSQEQIGELAALATAVLWTLSALAWTSAGSTSGR